MNFQLPALIVLVSSFSGIVLIVLKKMPALASLPENSTHPWEGYFLRLKKKFQEANPFKGTKPETFLQKLLSRVRILSLRADNRAMGWMESLAKRIEKKKNKIFTEMFPENQEHHSLFSNQSKVKEGEKPANDNYWQEIKTSVSAKRRPSQKKKKNSK